MSIERFKQLKSAFRLDDPQRHDREDVLAPVRQCVDQLNSSLKEAYTPGPFLTVDEQLIEFHGRIRFQRYIRSYTISLSLENSEYWFTGLQR